MNKNITPSYIETPREFELSHWQGHGELALYQLSCQIRTEIDEIKVLFKVKKTESESWYSSENSSPEYYKNWGLWNTDVVEFFLQGRDQKEQSDLPYIEFLVNPSNDRFALMTLIPRKLTFTPQDLIFTSHHSLNQNSWTTELSIKNPFKHSAMLWGNFHACLGPENKRQYYSAFHQSHPTPDFHRPDQFQLLGAL